MIRTIPLRAFLFMGAMCGAFALATLALTAGIVHAQAARTFVQEIPGTDVTVTMALEAEGPPASQERVVEHGFAARGIPRSHARQDLHHRGYPRLLGRTSWIVKESCAPAGFAAC